MTGNNLAKMNQEPTNTIYNCLSPSFWTTRQCQSCRWFFTPQDYQDQNYQLTFLEVLKTQNNILETVVQLTHLKCPCPACQEDSYKIEIPPKCLKKENSIN